MSFTIPPQRARTFDRMMAARLGLDETIIDQNFRADWTVVGGEDVGRVEVSFTAYLPADELLAMFNDSMRDPDAET